MEMKMHQTSEVKYCLSMRSIAINLLIIHQYLLIGGEYKVIALPENTFSNNFPSREGE